MHRRNNPNSMYGEIVKLTKADGDTFYIRADCYRAHYPFKDDKRLTVIKYVVDESSGIFNEEVKETCEQIHRLFDSEYAEKMEAIESKEAIATDPPPSKFCKLKPDPLWVYYQNLAYKRGRLDGVLEIMAFNKPEGRYHVRIVAFPDEEAYVYPHEVDFVEYDPNFPNTPAQPLNQPNE